jgi:hypothetical protein
VAQLYPQALGYLYFAFYDSQGYGGGIRLHLHTVSDPDFVAPIVPHITPQHGPRRNVSQYISVVTRRFVAAGKCLPSRCIATAALHDTAYTTLRVWEISIRVMKLRSANSVQTGDCLHYAKATMVTLPSVRGHQNDVKNAASWDQRT